MFHLGHALYDISRRSREHGIDPPAFVAQRAASQHDALAAMSATAHMLDADPSLRPAHFCHDSAADAAHPCQYMRHEGIVPIADWNPRHASEGSPYEARRPNGGPKGADGRPPERPSGRGVPVCAAGHEMVRDGYDASKMATKHRCPHARGRVGSCERWGRCAKSPHGRVVKTYDRTDCKLFGPVPHKSGRWRDIYGDRTRTERADNRVLNDCGVQSLTCRNGPKHLLSAAMACANMHLDAWLKTAAWPPTARLPPARRLRPPGAPNRHERATMAGRGFRRGPPTHGSNQLGTKDNRVCAIESETARFARLEAA